MVQDLEPAPDRIGAYMGLRTIGGARKPAWFVFAGGTRLTAGVSGRAGARKPLVFSGILSNRRLGRLGGEVVELQRLRPGRVRWSPVAAVATTQNGRYTVRARQSGGPVRYRVVWKGVCRSRVVRVAAPAG